VVNEGRKVWEERVGQCGGKLERKIVEVKGWKGEKLKRRRGMG
jgi:hypothetical protein